MLFEVVFFAGFLYAFAPALNNSLVLLFFGFLLAILKEVFKPAEGDHGADRGAERRE